MWTYDQSSGKLFGPDGALVTRGYSGYGPGKDDPDWQDHANLGPIPQGSYMIGDPEDVDGGPHGPFVLPLTPFTGNAMFGRSGFLLHGDGLGLHQGNASHGCVILARRVRDLIAASADRILTVVR